MGFVEAIKGESVVRIENGILTKGAVRFCDGHGSKRSDINGKETVIDATLTIWLCEECENPNVKWADKQEGAL